MAPPAPAPAEAARPASTRFRSTRHYTSCFFSAPQGQARACRLGRRRPRTETASRSNTTKAAFPNPVSSQQILNVGLGTSTSKEAKAVLTLTISSCVAAVSFALLALVLRHGRSILAPWSRTRCNTGTHEPKFKEGGADAGSYNGHDVGGCDLGWC